MTEGPTMCTGDGGAPVLSEPTDAEGAVVGVFSRATGNCAVNPVRDYFTEVAPFAAELLLPAFAAAGHDPWCEGNPGPGPCAGDGGAEADAEAEGGEASGGVPPPDASAVRGHWTTRVCTCTTVGAQPDNIVPWALLVLLGVAVRRRSRPCAAWPEPRRPQLPKCSPGRPRRRGLQRPAGLS
jgi:MYXO-CTERM domain-containing protein